MCHMKAREQGELIGFCHGSPVYYCEGDMLFCEQGASSLLIFKYLGNPLDLTRFGKPIRDHLHAVPSKS